MGLRHTGKYELSKHVFAHAYHYAMQYKEWKTEHNQLTSTVKAITYKPDRAKTNSLSDPIMEITARRLFLESKMHIIEETCRESDKFIWLYLLRGVTEENTTYQKLRNAGMPCGKNYYYDRRRRFYWLLSRKIS